MPSEPFPLTLLCNIHHVTIGIINAQNSIQHIGQQYTIEVYVDTDESLLLQCFPVSLSVFPSTPKQHHPLPETTININITSQTEVRLVEQSNTLIIPHLDYESWSLDCSASDPQEFSTLQDMFTHFIKFENRQKIRNTLAMISPFSYQMTRVVAENVSLNQDTPNENSIDDDHASSVVSADDFIATRENYYGQKLAVTMDENAFKDGLELRKVRLIYKTSQCMEVSSEWLARGIVSAGDSIAGYIQSGSNTAEEIVKTPSNTQLVSSKQRRYFDIVFNLTTMIGNMVGAWVSKLFNLTAVKQASAEFRMPTPKTQLGNSALQAASRVMEGSAAAAITVLSASRQTLVQAIEKKYGADAGYMAGKIIGANKSDEDDVMVYFDNHGISRKVVLQQSHSITSTDIHKKTANEPPSSFVVYEEKEKVNDQRQVVYDIEEQGYCREEYEKKPEKLILV